MQLHRYIVICTFFIIVLVLMILGRKIRVAGSGLKGTPTIDPLLFYSGKLALVTSLGLFLLKAIFPEMGYIRVPELVAWIATAIFCIAAAVLILSFIDLGSRLRMGLPEQDTTLVTEGVYRFSRNPLYTAIHLSAIASCLYFPDLLNVCFVLYGIVVHHYIIRGEERFLEARFGEEWRSYTSRVRRYF